MFDAGCAGVGVAVADRALAVAFTCAFPALECAQGSEQEWGVLPIACPRATQKIDRFVFASFGTPDTTSFGGGCGDGWKVDSTCHAPR
jgi:hypothetical protein